MTGGGNEVNKRIYKHNFDRFLSLSPLPRWKASITWNFGAQLGVQTRRQVCVRSSPIMIVVRIVAILWTFSIIPL